MSAFTAVLDTAGVRISMDGKGRWIDNVFVERLWRSLPLCYCRRWSSASRSSKRRPASIAQPKIEPFIDLSGAFYASLLGGSETFRSAAERTSTCHTRLRGICMISWRTRGDRPERIQLRGGAKADKSSAEEASMRSARSRRPLDNL